MGRMLIITDSNKSRLGIKKRMVKREFTIGANAIKYVAISIFTILSLVYLTQATEGANRSIKIREINDKKDQLELKKERLEVEKVRLQSLQEIDQEVQKPEMEPVSKVNHLEEQNSDLASAE